MSQQKPKKTFLKKGTRQFLSNATVRSLSQKPKIIDYTKQDQNLQNNFTSFEQNTNYKHQQKNNSTNDIVINVKPKNQSKQKDNKVNRSQIKRNNNFNASNSKKQSHDNNKNHNQSNQKNNYNQRQGNQTNQNASKSVSKKPTLLTDYLNNDNSNKQPVKKNTPVIPVAQKPTNKFQTQIVQSKAHQLKMQQLSDDSQNQNNKFVQNQYDQNQFVLTTKNNKNAYKQISKHQISTAITNKRKPNLLQEAYGLKEKQNIHIQPQTQQNEQEQGIKIDSDSDDQYNKKKNHFKSNKNTTKSTKIKNKERQLNETDQIQSQNEEINRKATVKMASQPHSKVTQMFNKNSQKQTNQTEITQSQQVTINKKLTFQDIPKQLIQQIVQKYFKQAKLKYEKKQSALVQQVKIVQKKQQSLLQQQKQFQKKVKQLQKQLQQKNKQFQSKLKNQQNKLTRQKMYLKDQQMIGKGEWKTKNQLDELKKQLQQQKNDKKRIQVKLKGQLDRLKARYNEEIQSKRILENRIKQYELKDIKQKQIKQLEQKHQKLETLAKKKHFWDDSPKESFLQRFLKNQFSLLQFQMDIYFYEKNQFYKYYQEKGQTDILQSQQTQGNKMKRTYQNGKIQIQSPQKFVKQVFPWGYTIVHYINGDIKQIIQLPNRIDHSNPKRIEIYYAKNNSIIQYSISQTKRIHYFLSQDQIQLTDQMRDLKQVYNGKQLQRINQGKSLILQKNAKGNFLEIY